MATKRVVLGSLSRLFVLRLVDRLEPISNRELRACAARANVALDFGLVVGAADYRPVTLGRFLRSLTGEGLITKAEGGYLVTSLGHLVLEQVRNSWIDGYVESAVAAHWHAG